MMRNTFYLCLFALILNLVSAIKVQQQATNLIKRNFTIKNNLERYNETERFRRLIPYMTFYFPANDYNAPQQMQQQQLGQQHSQQIHQQPETNYAFIPVQQVHQVPVALTQQKQPQQQHRPVATLQQHPKYVNRPQLQTVIYNTRNQQTNNKPYSGTIYQIPNGDQPLAAQLISAQPTNVQQKPQILYQSQTIKNPESSIPSPFLPTNKLPGQFTPMIYTNKNFNINDFLKNVKHTQNDYSESALTVQQPQHNQQPIRPSYLNVDEQPEQIQVTPQQNYLQYIIKTTASPLSQNHILYQKQPQNHQLIQLTTVRPTIPTKKYVHPQANQMHHLQHDDDLIYHTDISNAEQINYDQAPINYKLKGNKNYINQKEIYVQQPVDPTQNQLLLQKGIYSNYIPVLTSTTYSPMHYNEQDDKIQYVEEPVYNNKHQSHRQQQQHQQQHKNPQALTLTTAATPIKQHLTETTQIKPPSLTTYHPNFKHHQINYYPNHQSEHVQNHQQHSHHHAQQNNIKTSQRYQSVTKLTPILTTPTISTLPAKKPIPNTQISDTNILPDYHTNSLSEILKKLQDSNHLPHTLTPDNIDNSIRTLIKILNNLKQSQQVAEQPQQHHYESNDHGNKHNHNTNDDDYYDYNSNDSDNNNKEVNTNVGLGANSGKPGIDYPAFYEIPPTSFNCKDQRYKGFFGDPETNCQVWHYCDLNGGQASFLCPNGTIFSQVALTCDWWFNVKCSSTAQLYVLNERLYKYILPFTPKFPEDYSGPLVDKYLAIKFKEMEEKMTKQKTKGKTSTSNENHSQSDNLDVEDDEFGGSIDTEPNHDDLPNEYLEQPKHTTPYVVAAPTTTTTSSTTENPQKTTTIFIPSEQMHATRPTTTVESEQLEVIEISSDGDSGQINPRHSF